MKRRYGKTERRFTKFFRRFISAKRRLVFMCLARYGKRKEGKPARLFLLQIKRYVFDSSKQTDFPIIKREIDNAWLCRLDAGSMECIFNFGKYQIKSCNSESVCFIIHDESDFVITGGSDDFVLRVYAIKQRLHNYCVSLSRQRSQCRFVLVLFNDIKRHEKRNKNHADLCIRATRLGNPQSNSDGIRKNCATSSYSYLLAILQRNRKGREQDKLPIIRTD